MNSLGVGGSVENVMNRDFVLTIFSNFVPRPFHLFDLSQLQIATAGQAISRVAITDPTLMFDTFTLLQESFTVAYCLEFLSWDTIFLKLWLCHVFSWPWTCFFFFFFFL